MKQQVQLAVEQATKRCIDKQYWQGTTAADLADQLCIRRNTASHYLNQLVEEGKLLKINTRPVVFLHKQSVEQRFGGLLNSQYTSMAEFTDGIKNLTRPKNVMSRVIGINASLRNALEQIKAAALYPGQGLPTIFVGPTGSGKSYLAKIMHEYCIEEGVLPPSSPFVVFNCAQYVNNPELLTANLFGYVKGAFTGADSDKPGAFEAADGGILFLDEIHRLSPEGQEKLFVFMDQGRYQRLGESAWHKVSVRLVFATTEQMEDVLLSTFIRRIPVAISLPRLEERDVGEKELHIFSALLEEIRNWGKPVEISAAAFDALRSYNFKGSIGELRSTIKYLFASVYALNREAEILCVSRYKLPEEILGSLQQARPFSLRKEDSITIYPTDTPEQLLGRILVPQKTLGGMFKEIFALESRLADNEITEDFFYENSYLCIQSTLVQLLADNCATSHSKRYQSLLNDIQAVLREAETTLGYLFNELCVTGMACYFYYLTHNNVLGNEKQLAKLCKRLQENCLCNSGLIKNILALLSQRLDSHMTMADEVFLLLYLRHMVAPTKKLVRVLVAARGFCAQSIAVLANAKLKTPLVEWMNIPFSTEETEIVQMICNYIIRQEGDTGFFVMTDAMRLDLLTRSIQEVTNTQIVVTNSLSAELAIRAGVLVEEENSLDSLWRQLPEQTRPMYEMIFPKGKQQKAVVTCCDTGIGTANQLKAMLEASIPKNLDIKVIVQNALTLKESGISAPIFGIFDVLAIVGTTDPQIDGISFIPLDHLISGEGESIIHTVFANIADEEEISYINRSIVKNFSLRSVVENLTILDTEKVLQNVEEVLNALEYLTKKPLPNDKKITLYIHLSCMVERLVRQVSLNNYVGQTTLEQCRQDHIDTLRNALSVLEYKYSVKVPDSEIAYILQILQLKTQISGEYLQ